ncbi:MAG: hypothetical protein QGI45_02005, partial [Myxococcota bacterium]|nr:hypothetical protein [Myxococcota bacterium]
MQATPRILAMFIFFGSLCLYNVNTTPLPTWDMYGNIFTTLSLIHDGSVEITPEEIPMLFEWKLKSNEGERLIRVAHWDIQVGEKSARQLYAEGLLLPTKEEFFLVPTVHNNVFVNTFGPGAAILALPLFYGMKVLLGYDLNNINPFVQISKFVASVFIALSVAFIFLIGLEYSTTLPALLVALCYGLCTCAWSVGSQAFWQQTPNQFLLVLGLYLFILRQQKPFFVALAGFIFAAAVCCRPTSLFFFTAVGLYLLVKEKKHGLWFLAAGVPLGIMQALYNVYYFGSPLISGQSIRALDWAVLKVGEPNIWATPLLEGAGGLLLSPGRGLFIYSPILLFSLWGMYRALRDGSMSDVLILMPACFILMLTQFKWYDWWGGFTYGYRPLLDILPVLVLFLCPVLGSILKQRLVLILFGLTFIWSAAVQVIGLAYDGYSWDSKKVY